MFSTPWRASWGLLTAFLTFWSTAQLPTAGYVLTSDPAFAPRWVQIGAPVRPPALIGRWNGFSNGLRNPGQVQVCYSFVDETGKLSAMSPAVNVYPRIRDWAVVVNTGPLDPWTRACGTMWWSKAADQTEWFALGAGQNAQLPWQVYKPFLSLAAYEGHGNGGHRLFQAAYWPGSTDPGWQLGASALAAPPAPAVRLQEFPNCAVELAYSWKCNDGESPLSPVLAVPAVDNPNDPLYAGTRRDFHAPIEASRNVIPPQGALGAYVYLRTPGGTWHRQPSPCGDGDVWPVDFNRLPLNEFVRSGVVPAPGRSRSWLGSLHLALDQTARDVVVTEDQFVACPVISSYERPGVGLQFGRRVSKANGGTWVLRDVATVPEVRDAQGALVEPAFAGYPRGWPLWVENSQKTRLVGCEMELEESGCGVCFFDHSGGGAFHFRSTECGVHVQNGNTQRRTYGVRCLYESRGPGWSDHSASEPLFRDLDVLALYPVVVEGNQSANWTFDASTLVGVGRADSAIVTQANVGQVTFLARLTCDNARCVVASVAASRLSIANLFLDQGMPAWVCSAHYGTALRLTVAGNKVNQWSPWLHLAEVPSGGIVGSRMRVKLLDLDSQFNAPPAVSIAGPRAAAVEVVGAEDVALLGTLAPAPAAAPADRWATARTPPRGWKEPAREGIYDAARFRPAKRPPPKVG